MASLTKMNDGYGAAGFDLLGERIFRDYLEIQANPTGFKVKHYRANSAHPKQAEWIGADAVAVAAALCNGDMPPAILADFCDEATPIACDYDFKAGPLLREAL